MSARTTARQVAAKTAMLLGALFVFTLLWAALPAHRAPTQEDAQGFTTREPGADHRNMPGMDISDEHASEKAAVGDVTASDHNGQSVHTTMKSMRAQTPEDV